MRSLQVIALLASSHLILDVPAPLRAQAVIQPQRSDESAIVKVGGDVKAPVLIKSAEPKYPRSWFGHATSATVLVQLIVSEKGEPEEVHILKSGGDKFDKIALAAVAQYRFDPATKAGKPVRVQLNVNINFRVY